MSTRASVKEAAERAGVHDRTIRRWIAEGKLPAVRVGPRLVRVNLADVDALVKPILPAAERSA